MNLGDMVVRIVGDSEGLETELTKAEKRFKKYMKTMEDMGKTMSVAITAPIVAAIGLSIKSFSEAESATKRLSGAIDMAGTFTAGATKRLSEFATALMRATGVSDELIRNLMAQAVSMGRTEEEAKKLTQASIDIAARGILPLETAFETLQVTYDGIGIRSKELRAITGDLTEAQLRSGKAVDLVAVAVKGAGVEMRNTTSGSMANFKNSIDELGESFGEVLAPAFNKLLDTVAGLADKFGTFNASTKGAILAFAGVLAVAGPLLIIIPKIVTAMRTFSTAFATSTGPIGLVVAGVALLVAGIIKIIGLAKEFAEKEKLVNDALKGNLSSTEEYNQALEVQAERIKKAKEEQAKATQEYTGYNEAVKKYGKATADSMYAYMQKQSAAIAANKVEQDKAVADELANQTKIQNNLKILTKAEEAKAKASVAAAAQAAQAAADEAVRATEAAAALKEKVDGIKAVKEALETAGLTEAEIIDKEIVRLKEWGFTDAEVMAYMKQTHKEFYEADQTNIEDHRDAINKLYDEELAAEIQLLDEKEWVSKEVERLQEAEKQRVRDLLEDWLGYGQKVLGIFAELFSAIDAERQRDLAKDVASLDTATENQIAALNEELLGTEEYEKQKAAIEEAASKKKVKLEYDAAMASWRLNLAMGIANAAMAVLNGLLTQPFIPAGIIAGILAGVLGAVQVAAIAAAKPEMPALAAGGVALPTPGGRMVNVAEAGEAEGIIPLSQLDRMLSRASGGAGAGDEGDIHLVVNMDSRPILDRIFPATRNRTVLIDARAVVA